MRVGRVGAAAACCAVAGSLVFVGDLGARTECPSPGTGCGAPSAAPVVLAEPPFTVGNSNVIMWTGLSYNGWNMDNAATFDRFQYQVTVVDLATGHISHVTIGADTDHLPSNSTQAPASPVVVRLVGGQFPDSPASLDGRRYRFTVQAQTQHCELAGFGGNCADFGSWLGGPNSNPVTSVQDAAPPTASLAIAGAVQFTNQLKVSAHLDAHDPGVNASGVGFVQFSPTSQFLCSLRSTCASAFTPDTTVNLSSGPDGRRSVYARVWDNAASPSGAGIIRDGTPVGNVSQPASATILLDTTGPKLHVDRTPDPIKAGKPVSFDGSASIDQAGFNADSGVDAATAVWDFGDKTKSSGLASTHVYTKEGSYTATLTLRDKVGNQSVLEIPVTIKPSGSTGTGTTTQAKATTTTTTTVAAADTTPPAISNLKAHRTGLKARLTLSLSEPASLVVKIRRLRPAPQHLLSSFRRSEPTGASTVALPLRVSAHSRYRIQITPRDAAGNTGKTAVLVLRT